MIKKNKNNKGLTLIEILISIIITSVMVAATTPDFTAGELVFFTTIEKARFRQPVRPGDVLEMRIVKTAAKGPLWKFTGAAKVADKLVAEAEFGAMVVNPDR